MILAIAIWDSVKKLFEAALEFALGLGGPGLLLIAVADSSFLSIPEGNDLLIVIKSTDAQWHVMAYYVLMTVCGSTIGCSLLYGVGRWGSERIIRRFNRQRIEEIGRRYGKRGALTIVIPSMLPPPTPFKIFVLSAGIFRVPFPRFLGAVLIGRSIRYFMWGVLALLFGDLVRQFLVSNVKLVGMILLGAILLALLIYWMVRRRGRMTPVSEAQRKAIAVLVVLVALSLGARCGVKTTTVEPIPPAKLDAREATLDDLVALVNERYADLRNLVFLNLEIEFTGEAVKGSYIEENKYRRASGVLIASRPDSVYLNIKNPLGGATLAAMAAKQGAFQIWVPRENKYFTGSTDASDEQEESENPMLSVRPQHLLEGLLIDPLPWTSGDSFLTIKEDEDQRFKYYVVSVNHYESGTPQAHLVRELWFERSQLRLARQRYYVGGAVEADIQYRRAAEIEGKLVSTHLDIVRPRQRYSLKFEVNPEEVRIDRDLKDGAFEVPRPARAEWVRVGEESMLP